MDAGITGSPVRRVAPLLGDRSGLQRVTNIEPFFDLVYVFAITQLSHHLLGDAVCLAMLQLGPGNPHGVHRQAPRLDVTARARTAGRVAAPTS